MGGRPSRPVDNAVSYWACRGDMPNRSRTRPTMFATAGALNVTRGGCSQRGRGSPSHATSESVLTEAIRTRSRIDCCQAAPAERELQLFWRVAILIGRDSGQRTDGKGIIAGMDPLDVGHAQANLPAIVQWVASTWEKVPVLDENHSLVFIVPGGLWYAFEDTLDILGDAESLKRIEIGDNAIQNGDFLSQREIAGIAGSPQPGSRGSLAAEGLQAQVQARGGPGPAANPAQERWHLVIAGPVMRELGCVAEPFRSQILSVLLGALLDDPRRVGTELRATLARRWSMRIAGYRLIYRLDTLKHAVRIIDVSPVSAKLDPA